MAQKNLPLSSSVSATNPASGQSAGVNSMRELLAVIAEISDETCNQFGDDIDGRDYVRIGNEIEASVRANLNDPARRDGFLRALSDVLCEAADAGPPGPEWDPIKASEAAYARAGLTSHAGIPGARDIQ